MKPSAPLILLTAIAVGIITIAIPWPNITTAQTTIAGHAPTAAEWANLTNAAEKIISEQEFMGTNTAGRTLSEEEVMGPSPAYINRYRVEAVPDPVNHGRQTLLRYDTITGRTWLYASFDWTNEIKHQSIYLDAWRPLDESMVDATDRERKIEAIEADAEKVIARHRKPSQ